MTRRFFPVFFLLTLSICFLAGCTKSENTTSSSSTSAGGVLNSMPDSGPRKYTVAFVAKDSHEFWNYSEKGTEAAEKEFNVNCEFHKPSNATPEQQKDFIEGALARGLDAVAIAPIDAENQAPYLDQVAERIPVLTQDSDLPPGSKRTCYIGTDNYVAGRAAGQLVKEVMPEGGKILIFVGTLDAQNAVERRWGVLDELAGAEKAASPPKFTNGQTFGKYTLLDTPLDGAKQEKCLQLAEDALVKYQKDVDHLCMVGLWAYNPPAMLSAVQKATLTGKVKIVAFDEYRETLQGIEEGHIIGTIVQQPYMFGYESVKMMAGILRGDKSVVPEGGVMAIPHRVIKKSDVPEFRAELDRLLGK